MTEGGKKMAKQTTDYNASQIQILEGLEAVRKRPGMYIGSTSAKGLHHLVWEIVDNSIDEHLAGYCSEIKLTIHKDDSITVEDNGRGIPVGIKPELGITALEAVLTILHAGGKFGGPDSGYKVSGGLHGVGSSCVNALSDPMEVTVKQSGKVHVIGFEKGKVTKPFAITGKCPKEETGTTTHYKPDPEIFKETTEHDFRVIYNRMKENAFLNKGLRIIIIDERQTVEETGEFLTETLCYENGIVEFVTYINTGKKVLHEEPIYIKDRNDEKGVEIEVALQYNDDFSKDGVHSFANNIKTGEGGTHETGFKTAITNTVKQYITTHGLNKGKKELPNGEDTRVGLTAIVSVKVPEPEFEGQTKGKLTNSGVSPVVNEIISEKLLKYFEENPDVAELIVKKAMDSCEMRLALRKAREAEQKKRKNQSASFSDPEKLAPCESKDNEITEIYIVEGDSAGGSAKQGRDKNFQAVLPLKGKIINTEKAKLEKILENDEIAAMGNGFGTGVGEEFDYEKRKYRKVVIMTDADVDGAHIRVLILTFFYRYMRPLLEHGHVFIANPPLYKVQQGKKIQYAYNDRELEKILSALPAQPKPGIQRYKGLGEMNPNQLWETTMDPEYRKLTKVTLGEAEAISQMFEELMGDDPSSRKLFISEHVKEAKNIDI